MQTFDTMLVYAGPMLTWFHSTAMQLLHKLCGQGLPTDAFEELLECCEALLPHLSVLLQHLCHVSE